MRVLVLDTTHGGDVLARRFLARGDEVVCVDVYRNCPGAALEELRAAGADAREDVPPGRYDLAVMPAHCPARFLDGAEPASTVSFSRAVSMFVDDGRFRVEVTGVKGKTSACHLIAKMLHDSGRRVLLHSSRGEGPWTDGGHVVERRRSIAPPYLLELADGGYDAVVAEVSLGGSGRADVACVTNLAEDYPIAGGTRRASEAKADVFSDGVNLVPEGEVGFWSAVRPGVEGYPSRVRPVSEPALGRPLRVSVDYCGVSEVELAASYVQTEYLGAMDLALEVCLRTGVPRESALRSLETFEGVPGRGQVVREGGLTKVIERNPGITALSVERTLSCLEGMGALDGATVLLDPVSRKVCDRMRVDEIRGAVEAHGLRLLVTEGDGRRPELPGSGLLVELVKEAYRCRASSTRARTRSWPRCTRSATWTST